MFNKFRRADKNLLDKYYTMPRVVERCLKLLNGELKNSDLILEPSAGNGAFLNAINHPNKIGMDIAPECHGILKRDWFKYKINSKYNNVTVIGNPPFGASNSLSRRFIEHALTFDNVNTIAFILPDVYNKHTKQKILPANWRISAIKKIKGNSFVYKGEEVNIPCSFFVFKKGGGMDLRFKPEKYTEAIDFLWGNKNNYDMFIFGAAPSRVVDVPARNNRGYYILSKIRKNELKDKITKVNWNGYSSASGGVYWLTKPEIVFQYNNFYGIK